MPPVIEIPQVLGMGNLGFGSFVCPGTWSCQVTQIYHEIMHGIHFGLYLFILYLVVRSLLIEYMIAMCFKFETFTFDEEIIVTSCKT